MVWSPLGQVIVSGGFQPFSTVLVGDELLRIEISIEGNQLNRLRRLDFIEIYPAGLTRHVLGLPVKDISVIHPLPIDPLINAAGFSIRQLAVKHNIPGLSDDTVLSVECFNWS